MPDQALEERATRLQPDLFKAGMRRLAAGVSIVTTMDEGTPHGLVATAVSSVSAEPRPTLLVCVNQSASAHDSIGRSGYFCVNVLGQDDDDAVRAFSTADRSRRFEGPRWTALETGSPALSDALASFDCVVTQEIIVNSHTIFIGEVLELRLWRETIEPLIYIDGRFGGVMTTVDR